MTKISKVQILLLSASLIFMMWVAVFMLPLLTNKSSDELLHHTPDNAISVITVNNSEIFERFLFDALYKKGFSSNELDQLAFEKNDMEMPSSGIDLRENIVIFQYQYNESTLTGFLFNLVNKSQFSTFELQGKNEIKFFNDEIGCVLIVPENHEETDRLYFEQYAKSIVMERKEQLPSYLTKTMDDERLINLYYKGHESTYIQHLKLSARIEGSSIHFKGEGVKNPNITYESGTFAQIKSAGQNPYLEIRAGQLPDSVYSYFDVVTRNFNVKVPPITSQQIYFYGFVIDNIDGSTAFLPKFDAVFRFKDTIDIARAVDSLCTNESKVQRYSETSVKVGEMIYHFDQRSPFEVIAGISEKLEIEEVNKAPLPLIQGNPAATLNFEGEGIIAQIAQMLPPVKYSKQLFNDLEYFELHTEDGDGETLEIKGEMRFPNNQKASLEIFKFLMKF